MAGRAYQPVDSERDRVTCQVHVSPGMMSADAMVIDWSISWNVLWDVSSNVLAMFHGMFRRVGGPALARALKERARSLPGQADSESCHSGCAAAADSEATQRQ